MDRLILQFGQSRVILILIMIVGGIVGYMTYSSQEELLLPENPIQSRDTIASFGNFKLDFSILEDPRYKNLSAGTLSKEPDNIIVISFIVVSLNTKTPFLPVCISVTKNGWVK